MPKMAQYTGKWLLLPPSDHIQSETLFQTKQDQERRMNGPASLLHSWHWVLLTEYWLTCSAALILSRSFCNNNSSTVHYALINTLTTMTSTTNGSLHQELFCFTAPLPSPMETTLPHRLRGGRKFKLWLCVCDGTCTFVGYDGTTATDNYWKKDIS